MSQKVVVNGAAFNKAVVRQVNKFIKEVTRAIKREMQNLMRQPKSGRVYKYRGRSHRASAPGESPAIRSGKLFKSIRESFPNAQTGVIEVDAPYAGFLEQGTKFTARRPFVAPAIKTVREQIQRGGLKSLAD